MNIGKTLFAQLMDFLPWSTFARIVAGYGGDGPFASTAHTGGRAMCGQCRKEP